MAELDINGFRTDGTDVGFVSASSGGDKFSNNGRILFLVKNGDSSSKDVTFTTSIEVEGESVSDKTVTVAAGATRIFGPFDQQVYNDSNGQVVVNYSAVTSVEVAAVQPSELKR